MSSKNNQISKKTKFQIRLLMTALIESGLFVFDSKRSKTAVLPYPGAEPHVNTCYKHFYYFVTEFNLMNEKEFEPLKEMTQRICTDLVQTSHSPAAPKQSSKATSNITLPPTVEER